MRFTVVFLFAAQMAISGAAQYAPQATLPGSTALAKTSPLFQGWATGCTVDRGLRDIAVPDSGFASIGIAAAGQGFPDAQVVSLGDSGRATLTFAAPIYNGPGADFAVFENGFANPANAGEAFLELAFVEVSSDGTNFKRFPAHSYTQTTTQTAGAGDYLLAEKLNNLAGKYIGGYGTPFDLEELKDASGLDVNHIIAVRLVDVVGAISENFASLDSAGEAINDPYPTNFPSSGFDLDAVGAIHLMGVSGFPENIVAEKFQVFPVPARDEISFVSVENVSGKLEIFGLNGGVVLRKNLADAKHCKMDVGGLSGGFYIMKFAGENGAVWFGKMQKF